MEEKFVEVGGNRLHVVDSTTSGSPAILVAGVGNTAAVWGDFFAHLSTAHRVIAVTRRGYGRSHMPNPGTTIADLAGDLLGLLDALSLERAHVVGHSAAGSELAYLAHTAPDRAGSMVFLDAAYDRRELLGLLEDDPTPALIPPPTARRSIDDLVEWYRSVFGVWSGGIEKDLRESFTTTERGVQPVTPATVAHEIVDALFSFAVDWTAVTMPALAMYAIDPPSNLPDSVDVATKDEVERFARERYVPWQRRQVALFAESVPHAQVMQREGADHLLFAERPAETANVVKEFLAACDVR
ncbi:alpha/beta fold hydrolase [Microcella sp.]|uniref:alpha/beta fold hydrolase n=1 Tax=Microcella sp. TaxID=1913979 RepID=UPI00256DBA70|nr:alpha/beta hydrolase [Microcella sp.]MBX9471277.1 alpha/beta hydrolase [Microcella sp.]